MDPGTLSALMMMLGMMGSSAISSATQPRPNGFRGVGISPEDILKMGLGKTNDLYGALSTAANKGVNLRSSYAQTPPSYAGGGMPMPFGVTGTDPALRDPSLLSLPGLGIPGYLGGSTSSTGGVPNAGGPNGDGRPNPNGAPTTGTAVPRPPGQVPGTSTPAPPPNPSNTEPGPRVGRNSVGVGIGDDPAQALAAFRMMGFKV